VIIADTTNVITGPSPVATSSPWAPPGTLPIPGFIGGPEVFGIASDLAASDFTLDGENSGRAKHRSSVIGVVYIAASTAILSDWASDQAGQDLVLFGNTSPDILESPALSIGGMGGALLTGGIATQDAFGGSGPVPLAALVPEAVYGVVVPESPATPAIAVSFDTMVDGEVVLIETTIEPEDFAHLDNGDQIAFIFSGTLGTSCDFNGDGSLNFFDIAAFITAFNVGDLSADFAAPFGVLNFFDISEYITQFNAGCP
ncbi:MAG: GC-type dockerin domain-anchored protein, partial [Phycisphaerales bacterium]